ncbi:MAG: hypothetical protein WAS73_15810 [Defluviicoccus sp.]
MPSEHIQIPAVEPVARYEATGEQTSFAYPFPIFEPENLEVYLADTAVASGFTVTGAGETEGGQVVFATAPGAGTVVTLRRRVQAERTTDFQESGDLRAKVLNDQFDHLTAAVQDVAADVTRCIRVPQSESIGPESLALPPASERRNKWLGFDADGHLIVSGVASSGGGGAQGGLPPAQVPAAGGMWGEIGGTLSAQADLWSALAAKAAATHNHDATYTPAGHAGSRGASHGLATTTIAGFMAPEDKVKLNGIAAGAEINLTPGELVNALNTQLGSTAWQSSGTGAIWGGITGALSDQTDLYAQLAGKAAASHSHTAATIQAAGFLSAADKTKLDGIEAFARADIAATEIVNKVNEALGGTAWQTSGSGSGSPVTWYDEQTQLGQQTKVKFTGAGVGAAVNGDTVEVTIAAQAAAAAGANATVQFNSGGAIAGAAGIKVKSPTNGPGYTNHILHANTYTGGCSFETVVAGGSMWPDSNHDVAYDIALQGSVTLKGSNINVQNNNEIASTKVYLRNMTSSAISVTIDTGDGHFTEVIGVSNPFSIDANATKIVYLTARKNASGTTQKAVEG